MTQDEIIENALKRCADLYPSMLIIDDIDLTIDKNFKGTNKYKEQAKKIHLIVSEMEQENLVEILDNGLGIKITAFGLNVLKNGGYIKHKDHKIKQIQADIKRQDIADQKAIIDLQLAKWQVKTYWPLTIYAALATIVTIYLSITSVQNKVELTKAKTETTSVNKTPQSTKDEVLKAHDDVAKATLQRDTIH